MKAFTPYQLGNQTLKNRFIKTGTYEGMSPGGVPNGDLITFHSRLAQGGVALTTVSYGAVNEVGRTHENQLLVNDQTSKNLGRLVDEVHSNGGKASIQLTHCGFFSSNKNLKSKPLAPSRTLNLYGLFEGLGFSKPMNKSELEQTKSDFVKAARRCVDLGFDAIEIHMGHGYLLSQFLSPLFNHRNDEYGGELENRMRFPLEVIESVRKEIGTEAAILCKTNMDDGLVGGFHPDESILFTEKLYEAGCDATILSGGITSKNAFFLLRGKVPRNAMSEVQETPARKWGMKLFGRFFMKEYAFEENFFFNMALQFRKELKVPLVYLGGISSSEGVNQAMDSGFELVAVGRSLIHDPDFVMKLQDTSHVSPCNHCNLCLVEMDKGGVRCVI